MSEHSQTTCERIAEPLSLLASGDLPDGERGVVSEHLQWCQDCSQRLEQLRRVAALLRVANPEWLDASAESVAVRVEQELAAREASLSGAQVAVLPELQNVSDRFRSKLHGWIWLAASVAAALLAWLAVQTWIGERPNRAPFSPIVPEKIVEVEPLLQRNAEADGLKAGSGFPTWLELQRALGESEEAFERTLAQGSAGGFSRAIEVNSLFQEWSQ